MAAAPELLDACRAAETTLRRFLANREDTDVTPDEIEDVLALVRAALAKTRGEVGQ